MSDVLFDTGKYSLKPGAREKLAKVAGILLAYPGLNIEVGGYTDNVGGDAMNQTLSENRAGSVRDYLVQQGVATNSVSARGFGNTLPVASNDNSAGRQQNRQSGTSRVRRSHRQPGQRNHRKLAVRQDISSNSIMEATFMKLVGVISTAVLSLIPRNRHSAQDSTTNRKNRHDARKRNKAQACSQEKEEEGATRKKPPSRKRKTRSRKRRTPSRKRKMRSKRTTQQGTAMPGQPEQEASPQQKHAAAAVGRIPADRSRPISDANIGFASAKAITAITASNTAAIGSDSHRRWPSNWLYTQDVYVVEIDGVYYLCNASYPGVNLVLSVTM